ncbi:hypothetical protein J6590_107426, partial [Homalodisca vitripennis]
FVRNFRDLSVLLGSARLCPHSFSPPRLITPLNLTREELVFKVGVDTLRYLGD